MVNEVTLIGNLGDVVKLHYFDGGNCVGRFPMATSHTYTNKQTGEKITDTEWHNIVVRNKIAENCEKYLKKGSKAYVKGSIRTRKYQGQDGKDIYTTEIMAQTVQFLDPPNRQDPPEQRAGERTVRGRPNSAGDHFLDPQRPNQRPDDLPEEEYDDLPF